MGEPKQTQGPRSLRITHCSALCLRSQDKTPNWFGRGNNSLGCSFSKKDPGAGAARWLNSGCPCRGAVQGHVVPGNGSALQLGQLGYFGEDVG